MKQTSKNNPQVARVVSAYTQQLNITFEEMWNDYEINYRSFIKLQTQGEGSISLLTKVAALLKDNLPDEETFLQFARDLMEALVKKPLNFEILERNVHQKNGEKTDNNAFESLHFPATKRMIAEKLFYPEVGHGLYDRLQKRIDQHPQLKEQLQALGYFAHKAQVTEEMYRLIISTLQDKD